MLNAAEAAARYTRRDQDVYPRLFASRLAVCQSCPRRAGLDCNAAGGSPCTILARRKEPCPEFRWPGDARRGNEGDHQCRTPETTSHLDAPESTHPIRKSACVLPAPEGQPIIGPIPAAEPLDPDLFAPLHPRYLTRNLICHLYPLTAGQKWRRTVEHLAARQRLFNGRRLVTVARDHNCDTFADVAGAFHAEGLEVELTEARNNPALGETVAFAEMLSQAQTHGRQSAGVQQTLQQLTFYCHSKGATWPESASQAHEWADVMFAANLDYPQLVTQLLSTAAVCGAFRRRSPLAGSLAAWHYSGTFFWFRQDALPRLANRVERVWSGVEAWPGLHFRHPQSACLFLDDCRDLYHADYWDRTVRCAWRRWKESRAE